jgi:hypothetical protein
LFSLPNSDVAPNAPRRPLAREVGSVKPVAISARATGYGPPEGETLLGKAGGLSTELLVRIEHPADGELVGEAAGAFLAGRALAVHVEFARKAAAQVIVDDPDRVALLRKGHRCGPGALKGPVRPFWVGLCVHR